MHPAVAAAGPCTATGAFMAGGPTMLFFWDLHDRAGEISGSLRFFAWNAAVDVKPSVRQTAAVSGSRQGNSITLEVADPLGTAVVRKVRATLTCSTLTFAGKPEIHGGREIFTRSHVSSPIRTYVDGQTEWYRTVYDGLIESEGSGVHDRAWRARVAARQARLRTYASAMLDSLAWAASGGDR